MNNPVRTMANHVLFSAALLISACADDKLKHSEPVRDADLAETSAIIAEPASPRDLMGKSSPRIPRIGVITAGDIDDTLNLPRFQHYAIKAQKATKLPRAQLSDAWALQLTGRNGAPAPGVHITLRRPGQMTPFFSGYSGVDGKITVFPALFGVPRLSVVELRAFAEQRDDPFTTQLRRSNSRHQVRLPFDGGWTPDFLDLAFVLDTTGSMGDEIAWLTRELRGIVRKIQHNYPEVNIRYGLVVYRDHGDDFVVRNYGFTKSQSQMTGWLRRQQAQGGGDYPEAAAAALATGAKLSWRKGKGERLLFHVADAPPHRNDARAYLDAARRLAGKNVQFFGLGASGVAVETEFLMRQAALQTNGRYIFLTDDSGVGYGHAEPTISCYQVTRLSSLLTRVLLSELSGRRHEAPRDSIIREVGSYRNGKCLE